VEKDYFPRYKLHKTAAELCFHGGRNECFWYGPTPVADPNAAPTPPALAYKSWRRPIEEPQTPGFFREFDLTGAYATCLSSLKIPDYDPRASDPGPGGLQDRRVGLRSREVRLPVWHAVPVPSSALIGSAWFSTRPMIKRETPSLPKPVAMVLRRSCIRHGSPLHSPSARRWSSLALTFENPLIGRPPRAVKTQSPRPRGASLRISRAKAESGTT